MGRLWGMRNVIQGLDVQMIIVDVQLDGILIYHTINHVIQYVVMDMLWV